MNLQEFEKIITPLSLLDNKSHREFLVKSLIGNFKEYKKKNPDTILDKDLLKAEMKLFFVSNKITSIDASMFEELWNVVDKGIDEDTIEVVKLPVPSQVVFYNPDQLPKKSEEDESFSDDVMIIDENGVHGIGYYDFELVHWTFHTDTLVDYDEPGHETKWKWYYPIFEIKDVFPEKLLKKS